MGDLAITTGRHFCYDAENIWRDNDGQAIEILIPGDECQEKGHDRPERLDDC